MKPRTLCGCQPVAFIKSARVAPPARCSRARISAFRLPSRAAGFSALAFGLALGAFLAGVVFFPAFPFFGATWAERAPVLAFFLAFGSEAWAVSVASTVVLMFSPFAVGTAVRTWITPVRLKCKWILLDLRILSGPSIASRNP